MPMFSTVSVPQQLLLSIHTGERKESDAHGLIDAQYIRNAFLRDSPTYAAYESDHLRVERRINPDAQSF
jgi:hypothetical protein